MIAAKAIKITSSDERRDKETLVTVLIPDLSGVDRGIASLKKDIAEIQASLDKKMLEIETAKADPELTKYLALDGRIKSGAIKLTDEQSIAWQKLVEKNAKSVNRLKRLDEELNVLDSDLKEAEEELSYTERDRDEIEQGISCVIDKVAGHTTVQTMKSISGIDVFNGMAGDGIRAMLQKVDSGKARIFSGEKGDFGWIFKKPAA
jgi:chromosome segregation ATPase